MDKETIIRIIKGYEHDQYFGADLCSLPSSEYESVANNIISKIDQQTKRLTEQLAEKEKELSEVKVRLEIAIKSCWNDKD